MPQSGGQVSSTFTVFAEFARLPMSQECCLLPDEKGTLNVPAAGFFFWVLFLSRFFFFSFARCQKTCALQGKEVRAILSCRQKLMASAVGTWD